MGRIVGWWKASRELQAIKGLSGHSARRMELKREKKELRATSREMAAILVGVLGILAALMLR